MEDGKLLAYMYDFYNLHTLQKQNEDINFYINFIKKYKCKKVLIVGAGTGRVAIPLSKFADITALDMDKYRLDRLRKINKTIKIIDCNFLNYTEKENNYDLIIFPYSTIQYIPVRKNKSILNQMIKKIFDLVNEDTHILLDFSANFNIKDENDRILLFKDFSEELGDFVEVFYSAKKYKNYIKFIVEYHLVNRNYSVFEIEKYDYYDEKEIVKILINNKLNLLNIFNGYGTTMCESKHIYHLKKDVNEK